MRFYFFMKILVTQTLSGVMQKLKTFHLKIILPAIYVCQNVHINIYFKVFLSFASHKQYSFQTCSVLLPTKLFLLAF